MSKSKLMRRTAWWSAALVLLTAAGLWSAAAAKAPAPAGPTTRPAADTPKAAPKPRPKRRPRPQPKVRKFLQGTAYDSAYDLADCNYHSICLASDGRIYFTLSSHRIDRHFRLACFDPKTGKTVFLRDINEAINEDTAKTIPQGKCHVPLIEVDKKIYFASHIGYYRKDRQGRTKYPGFHIMYYDMKTDKIVDVRQGLDEEGLITMILDKERMIFYGLTWPSMFFHIYESKVDKLWSLGNPFRGYGNQYISRTLALHPDGTVYFPCEDGRIFWYHPTGYKRGVLDGVSMRQAAVQPADEKTLKNNTWREILWDDKDRRFYGIHLGSQSLFSFDPKSKQIKPILRFRAQEWKLLPEMKARATLGFVMGPKHTLYYLVHGPSAIPVGKTKAQQTMHLLTYDLDRKRYTDHGPIDTQGDSRPFFTESLLVTPEGDVYTVAWVRGYKRSDEDEARLKALREEGAPVETRDAAYRIMLVKVPAGQIRFDR